MSSRHCEVCFKPFTLRRADQWLCSTACRVRKCRKGKKANRPCGPQVKCEVCPTRFEQKRPAQRFCGRDCQVRANTLRVKARLLRNEREWGIERIAIELGVTSKIVRAWLQTHSTSTIPDERKRR